MQPNNNAMSAGTPTVAPSVNATAQKDDIVFSDKSRRGSGMMIGMIVLALLAAGGIGFGMWAYLSGGQKEAELNGKISDLESQLVGQSTVIGNDGAVNGVNDYKNPVIKSTNSEKSYSIMFESSLINSNTDANIVSINLENGAVSSCELGKRTYEADGGNGTSMAGSCRITGLDGEIYRIVEIGAGHDNSENVIGFIMTDGTVKYIPLYDAIERNEFAVKGSLKIDGYVIDKCDINVGEGMTGYHSTVFVLSDGTFIEYDKSMLN